MSVDAMEEIAKAKREGQLPDIFLPLFLWSPPWSHTRIPTVKLGYGLQR
jgi:hypothetical protein